jgi:hypothetical protein
VLAAEDIAIAYGPQQWNAKFPTSQDIALPPDPEWIETLKWTMNKKGKKVPLRSKRKKPRKNE